jgi:hypothetical protein
MALIVVAAITAPAHMEDPLRLKPATLRANSSPVGGLIYSTNMFMRIALQTLRIMTLTVLPANPNWTPTVVHDHLWRTCTMSGLDASYCPLDFPP